MTGPAITVENLSLQLGTIQVLDHMNFSIASGSIHCFIGPNGGGKTTTLRCLLGQMPHQGRITLDWMDDNHSIGYVPQLLEMERTLPLTVTDFMAIVSQDKPAFSGILKTVRRDIDTALEKVGLADKRHYMIGSLSGGERQRLLFAQALIPAPALLILDEPMTSLDETGARVFQALITDMHAAGVTVLWVNHDLQQVRSLADSVTVIDGGVLAHGPTGTTLTDEMAMGNFHRTAHQAVADAGSAS